MAEKNTDQSLTAIDAAIAAAQARKAAKASANGGSTPKAPKASKEPSAPREPKRPRLTDEEKAARLETRNQERAARKATRDAARAEKLAARAANKQPAHMRKVQKAAEKLGALGQAAELLFNEATTNLSAAELATLALHIQHFNRVQSTSRALGQKLTVGTPVSIIGGDPRFIGKTGTIAKAQRIRCYVSIEGIAKPVYLFTSDVTASAAAETSQAASA